VLHELHTPVAEQGIRAATVAADDLAASRVVGRTEHFLEREVTGLQPGDLRLGLLNHQQCVR